MGFVRSMPISTSSTSMGSPLSTGTGTSTGDDGDDDDDDDDDADSEADDEFDELLGSAGTSHLVLSFIIASRVLCDSSIIWLTSARRRTA